MTKLWSIDDAMSADRPLIATNLISRNMATSMAWMPEHPAVFVQTSEDLYFRLFDCRDGLALQQ